MMLLYSLPHHWITLLQHRIDLIKNHLDRHHGRGLTGYDVESLGQLDGVDGGEVEEDTVDVVEPQLKAMSIRVEG